MAIDKCILGVAGEFAVATELCRRNMYAQLTLGNQKRADLLVINENINRIWRIEVKAKQGRDWPQCKGISRDDSFLVFVDFEGKSDTQRPDFYVLTGQDWRELCNAEMAAYTVKHPDRRIEMTSENVIRLLDELGPSGKPYQGMGVRPRHIAKHLEAWGKLEAVANAMSIISTRKAES